MEEIQVAALQLQKQYAFYEIATEGNKRKSLDHLEDYSFCP
jgi:hypothetical protein